MRFLNDSKAHKTVVRVRPISWQWVFSCLILIVIIGAYIRIKGGYFYYPLNDDEAMHVGIASGSSLAEVLRYSWYETHPPLFYILLHYWMKISSNTAFLRGLPFLLGMTLIPIYYFIGTKVGGRLCGLCCAILITFSYGCIIQSLLLRQYCIFLPALSLNFYCYLQWRDAHRHSALLGYIFFGWLAALSHFSFDFYLFCIAFYEMCHLLRSGTKRQRLVWISANLTVAVLVAFLYYIWQPTLSFYKTNNMLVYLQVFPTRYLTFLNIISAPYKAALYIYPWSLLMLIAAIFYFIQRVFSVRSHLDLRPYFILAVIACFLSIVIYGAKFYPKLGARHSLWMLPLIIPVIGAMTADALASIKSRSFCIVIGALMSIILFLATNNSEKRFNERTEYNNWQRGPWQQVTSLLERLGHRDVIITNQDGVNLLVNSVSFRSDEAFMNSKRAALVPYHDTHILISADYFGNYNGRALQNMMEDAQSRGLLDLKDQIVFLNMSAGYQTLFNGLLQCRALEKQIIYTYHEYYWAPSAKNFNIVSVSKSGFFNTVLAPAGNAHFCLDERRNQNAFGYLMRTAKQFSRR